MRNDGVAPGIHTWRKRGGERRPLASDHRLRSLRTFEDHLYFIGAPKMPSGSRAGIARVAKDAGEPEQLVAPDPMRDIHPFEVFGRHVYYRVNTDLRSAYELHRIRIDTRTDEVIVPEARDVPHVFAVDADGIFGFVQRNDGNTELVRIPLEGGRTLGLMTFSPSAGSKLGPLATDDQAIYWTVAEEECAYMRQLSIDLPATCRYRYRMRVFRMDKASIE